MNLFIQQSLDNHAQVFHAVQTRLVDQIVYIRCDLIDRHFAPTD